MLVAVNVQRFVEGTLAEDEILRQSSLTNTEQYLLQRQNIYARKKED